MCDSPRQDLSPGLFVVGTPIGNLRDLSPRARDVLEAAVLVASEDTRTTARLFGKGGRRPRMVSLTEHNTEERLPALLESAANGVVALVSEAGMPSIADPGARVVAGAHDSGIPVFVVPGPSALAAAVAASGFDGSDVHFLGFLPRKRAARVERLTDAAKVARTLVFFEAPSRLAGALSDLAEALDDPEVVVCRELTKVHEESVAGRATELAERFRGARGECTVVVRSPEPAPATDEAVRAYMGEMQRAGARRSAAASEAARRFGCTREKAYGLWDEGALTRER